jgi:heptosyltransferase-2
VIQTAHLGDVVLTLPLIMALARRAGPVDVVTTPLAAPMIAGHPAVRQTLPYDKRGRDRGLRALLRLAGELRGRGYQRAYLVQASLRSSVLARLARIPTRVCFDGAAGAMLCTERVARPPAGPMALRLLALAGDSGLPRPPWIGLTDRDRRRADDWLQAAGIGQPFVVLAPGARWGTKRWPGFPELAARLDLPIAVVGGSEDLRLAEAVVSAAPGRARNAAGQLDLRESAALIDRAMVVVTNDSLPLHLASALGRPAVAVFGPTSPAFGFGPLQLEDQVVEHPGLGCRPCSAHGPAACPLGHHRCMREIAVDQVLTAVRFRLDAATNRTRRATSG